MSKATLTKSIRHMIISHRDEIIEHLPCPGRVWQWSESGLSKSVLQRLAQNDTKYIVRDGRLDEWKTTEDLWIGVIHLLGVSEGGLGEDIGQERILAPSEHRCLRSPRDPQPAPEATRPSQSMCRARLSQKTLRGEIVPIDQIWERRNNQTNSVAVKDAEDATPDDPTEDPCQSHLSAWGVQYLKIDGTRLSRPVAEVY